MAEASVPSGSDARTPTPRKWVASTTDTLRVLLTILLLGLMIPIIASETKASDPQQGDGVEEIAIRQIALSEQMIKNFIKMQTALVAMADELEAADEKPDAKLKAKLAKLAKDSGFKSFDQFDEVASTVTLIMSGLDPDTGDWSDPKIGIRADIEEARADSSLSDAERKDIITDLEEALRTTPDVAHPTNIPIVKSFAREIESVLE